MMTSTNLVVDACPAETAQKVEQLLAMELRLRTDTASTSAVFRFSCETRLLTVERDGRRVERKLAAVDHRGRARVLAITFAELLDDPALAPPPPVLPPPPRVEPKPRPTPSRIRWTANIGGVWNAAPASLGVTAGAAATYRLSSRFGLGIHVAGDYARRSASSGSLQNISASGAAIATYRTRLAIVDVDLGVGARLGHAALSGHAESETTVGGNLNGWFWGPMLSLVALIPISGAVQGGLGLELGQTIAGIEGGEVDGVRIGVDGTWVRICGVVAWPE